MTHPLNTLQYRLGNLFLAALVTVGGMVAFGSADAIQAAESAHPPAQRWSWEGWVGTFDRGAAQRGLKVYLEVCSACHGIERVAWRNLESLGLSEAEVKALAAEREVTDGPNEDGDMFERAAIPSDRILSPFANDQAARAANGGALPPDLSLIIKSRARGEGNIPANFGKMLLGRDSASGADYLHALLTGYEDPPAGFDLLDGLSYNAWFPGNQIAMTPPLFDGAVDFDDGTGSGLDQMSRDVTTFLAWASEPELEQRRSIGVKVMIFLVLFLVLIIAVKRRVWAKVEH